MNQPNPYAPPTTRVADPKEIERAPCPHIELGIRILWFSIGLAFVDGLLEIFRTDSAEGRVGGFIGVIIGTAIGILILAWVARKLRAGRNWMRWLITSINVVVWLAMFVFWDFYRGIFAALYQQPVALVIFIVQSLLGLAFLVLLHTPTTRAWFADQGVAN